jgi:cell division transport system permease protein
MRLRSWGYFIREAARSLRHSLWMSVASVSTVGLALFVLGFFGVIGLNLQHAAATLNQQVEMRVFFNPGVSRRAEARLVATVRHWAHVRRVHYFTKAEALRQLEAEFPHDQDLWRLIQEGNPLYDGFDVWTDRPAAIPGVAARLRHELVVHQVVYEAQVIERLSVLTQVLQDAGYVIEGLLGLATLFIISNTIRLGVFARRREIAVMKLVGATDWFIRWPFLLEGVMLGLVGAIVADAAITVGYQWLLARAQVTLAFWPLAPLPVIQQGTLVPDLVGGVVMGIIGSLWAVRRFLNV